mmetsp:Transcript_18968/g.31456  ORF Transcript_18968/g.31456 Transcript_18968/m.31456 type:complete len:125 (+) Transcript_18968:540-914(+)
MMDTGIVAQVALNLTGQARDPFEIDGDIFSRERFHDSIVKANSGMGRLTYWCMHLQVSYYLDPRSDHLKKAFAELYQSKNERPNFMHDTATYCSAPLNCMMFGLSAIALEQETCKRCCTRKRNL